MAITKTQRIDRIEIERDATVFVRRVFSISEDGVEIATALATGGRYTRADDISGEPAAVRSIITAARNAIPA